MAILFYPNRSEKFTDPDEIAARLNEIGVDYERWDADDLRVSPDASDAEILAAYAPEIDALKIRGGYVTADVINVVPTTPGLDEMLAKFDREHTHSDDEVRYIVKGHGLFHLAVRGHELRAIEMEAGDLIRVPAGAPHWFNLCDDRTVRAIRLFKDPAGWVAEYT